MEILKFIMIPFLGTTAGAACVFFMRGALREKLQRGLIGFAAGVMTAASIWSLLIPSIERSADLGKLSFIPAVAGFWVGILFLLLLDKLIPHHHLDSAEDEGPKSNLKRTTKLLLAVTLHNIPEGMAVGVVCAGLSAETSGITSAGVLALAVGIAVQNFPEGAIISLPLKAAGKSRSSAFLLGTLSGAVEPAAALMTAAAFSLASAALPYLLSFAAGAMIYVVVEELIPETSAGKHSNIGTLMFAAGFTVMMTLDVALG